MNSGHGDGSYKRNKKDVHCSFKDKIFHRPLFLQERKTNMGDIF